MSIWGNDAGSSDDAELNDAALVPPWQPQAAYVSEEGYKGMHTDPVKYKAYNNALRSWVQQHTHTTRGYTTQGLSVVVAGGGFGQLAHQCLLVLHEFNLMPHSHVLILEMNPLAIAELDNRRSGEWLQWSRNITIWGGDMRDVRLADLPEIKHMNRVDAIVSELLGGFGDNELAPECLYNLEQQAVELNRSLGLPNPACFPCKIESWLAPVSSISAETNDLKEKMSVINTEWPVPIAEPKRLYEIGFPQQPVVSANEIAQFSCRVTFDALQDTICTGFAGYLQVYLDAASQMYNPQAAQAPAFSNVYRHETPDLREWNPVFFPVKIPFRGGGRITVEFTRRSDDARVWYEWAVFHNGREERNNADGAVWSMQRRRDSKL